MNQNSNQSQQNDQIQVLSLFIHLFQQQTNPQQQNIQGPRFQVQPSNQQLSQINSQSNNGPSQQQCTHGIRTHNEGIRGLEQRQREQKQQMIQIQDHGGDEDQNDVNEYNDRLNMLYVAIRQDTYQAIIKANDLLNHYSSTQLEKINESENLDFDYIEKISQRVDRLDDQFLSNLLRVILSECRLEWGLRDKKHIEEKVIKDLANQKSDYALDLLKMFKNTSIQWKEALLKQTYLKLPTDLLNLLFRDEENFEFLMECLLAHRQCAFDYKIVSQIWKNLNIGAKNFPEPNCFQNIKWMIDLSTRSQSYLEVFKEQDIFELFSMTLYKQKSIDAQYVKQITKFICWLLTEDYNKIMPIKMQQSKEQNKSKQIATKDQKQTKPREGKELKQNHVILTKLQNSGLMISFPLLIGADLLIEMGIELLFSLKQILYNYYKEQLIEGFPCYQYYQYILFNLLVQDESEKIKLIALNEAKDWLKSEQKEYFEDYFERRKELINAEMKVSLKIKN